MPEVLIGILVAIGIVGIVNFGVAALSISMTPEEIGPNFKRLVYTFFFEELPAAMLWVLRVVISFFPKPEVQEGESQ